MIPSLIPESVLALKDVHLEGNIIPVQWFQCITFENGKPDTNAILLLSDIVYWYRPTLIRDEQTGHILGYRKKFKADLLQKSYQNYELLFGFSKKQIREAFIRLETLGLIKRVFRTLETSFGFQTNVMFIELYPSKLLEITQKTPAFSNQGDTSFPRGKQAVSSKELSPSFQEKTYTEITQEITPSLSFSIEPSSDPVDSSDDALPSRSYPPSLTKEKREELEILKMVQIWNDRVQKELSTINGKEYPIRLTKERTEALRKVLHNGCNCDFGLWEEVCRTIVSSKFLMGEVEGTKFRVSFDWAIKLSNFLKILEGGFTSGDRDQARFNPQVLKIQRYLIPFDSQPKLKSLLEQIIKIISIPSFLSWFSRASFSLEGDILTIFVPTRFMKDWISRHFLDDLTANLTSLSQVRVFDTKKEKSED